MTDGSSQLHVQPANPIGDYGPLGDTRTAALVSSDGAIDWLCVPRFDGDPIGRLVGGPPAGTFRVGPADPTSVVDRRYGQHTATLETTWAVGERRLTLTDVMVAEVARSLLSATLLVRHLAAEGGPVAAAVDFAPNRPAMTAMPPSFAISSAYIFPHSQQQQLGSASPVVTAAKPVPAVRCGEGDD